MLQGHGFFKIDEGRLVIVIVNNAVSNYRILMTAIRRYVTTHYMSQSLRNNNIIERVKVTKKIILHQDYVM